MKPTTIEHTELATPRGRDKWLAAVRAAATSPVNGELRDLTERIRTFELRRGVSTADMRRLVASGEMEEDAFVCEWLQLVELRSYLEDVRAASAAHSD